MAIWFITGCSTGFGHETALAALAHGDKVIATARNPDDVNDLADKGALIIALDLSWPEEKIQAAVQVAIEPFGTVDVLFNNAGVNMIGSLEEVSSKEARAMFDVNYWGHISVTRAILPYMRAQKHGTIGFNGSMLGWYGLGCVSTYTTTKWAIAGLVHCLREEVKEFGINVTVIEVGFFRTQVFGENKKLFPKKGMDEYKSSMAPLRNFIATSNGRQPGDPEKAAKVIVEALTGEGAFKGKELPARLLLGADAVAQVEGILDSQKSSLEEWKSVSISTDFTLAE
ncbi:putative oxidoreductase [Lachnellula subtilissima]|uniref:Putative oxidoreductase n=1 Tax=Lachnellula subtilissima TaxID=602034 RepID=A0A8H8UA01_9HELO|nr:putative oxidoreductase [Lachnellula subtilissima]